MSKQLIMYSRSNGCPFVTLAKRVLKEHHIHYQEIFIDKDATAEQNVLDWTGFLSVPTLIIAEDGENTPYTEPDFLEHGASPRGINRGSMITEPNMLQLKEWLQQHAIIEQDETT